MRMARCVARHAVRASSASSDEETVNRQGMRLGADLHGELSDGNVK